jgi:hypothetical protein
VLPFVVTETGPVVAPAGTAARMLVEDVHVVLVAGIPLKETVPLVPKLVPVSVTCVPTVADEGEMVLMYGRLADELFRVIVLPTLWKYLVSPLYSARISCVPSVGKR